MTDAVVIAGGVWQRFLVLFLKEKGYQTWVVNPVRSETVTLADHWIESDVKDIEKVLSLLQNKPAFITSDQSEVAILPVAKLSRNLGLPGNDPAVIRLFTDKSAMYKNAEDAQVPFPQFGTATNIAEALEVIERIGYPVILKPLDSTSSRGFTQLLEPNLQALEEAFAHSKQFAKIVIIQRFVSGLEVTLEGLCSQGQHITVASSLKQHFRPGIASSLRYPAAIPEALLKRIVSANNRFVSTSGLSFGITHAEYMVDVAAATFNLIEIAARGGGCGISSEIIPWTSGIHTYQFVLDCLTGNPPDVNNLEVQARPAILQFYEFPPGPTDDLLLDEAEKLIRQLPGVHYWHYNFTRHQYLKPATSDQDRHALVILHCNKEEEVDATLDSIDHILRSQGFYDKGSA